MSRVLVEACAVGTPVIVHDYGLLANLGRRHGLGFVIDCNDSPAFRESFRGKARAGDERRLAAATRLNAAKG